MLHSTTKTYPLTTIDALKLSSQPEGFRYRYLRDLERPKFWVSYRPIHLNWGKLIAREPSLDLGLAADEKEALLEHVVSGCRYGELDVTCNRAVAEAIYDWAKEADAVSISHSFSPYRLPLATHSVFQEGITVIGGEGYGIFLDPRSSGSQLTVQGRKFLHSAMYWKMHGIAEYVDIKPALLTVGDGKVRRARLIEFEGPIEYSQDEVVSRLARTEQIWLDVQLERRAASIKARA